MACDVVLGLNTLDPSTWATFEGVELASWLFAQFGERFPKTGRVYHESVDREHDVTPTTEDECRRVLGLQGTLYVLVYPEGADIAVATALFFISAVVIPLLFPEDKKDPGRPIRQGSPNNALNSRQNRARLLGRIPDIFGSVRATPDLVAHPRISYVNHREQELCVMCLGAGTHQVIPFNIFEGDNRAQNVEGLSVEIYLPGVLPGIGSPDVSIGAAIGETAQNVYQVEAVNGQLLPALNQRTVHGAILVNPKERNVLGLPTDVYGLMAFRANAPGTVGFISVPLPVGTLDITDTGAVTDKIQVGDVLECRFDRRAISMQPGAHIDGVALFRMDKSGLAGYPGDLGPNLSDDNLGYEVTAITTFIFNFTLYVDIQVDIPVGKQAAWAAITTYAGAGGFYCASVLLTPRYRAPSLNFANEMGPFFIDDPGMETVQVNFVAEGGLYIDDGKNIKPYTADMRVYLAPASSSGVATGPYEEHLVRLRGSTADNSTRAITEIITPSSFPGGRCLISVIRSDFVPWREEDVGQGAVWLSGSGDPVRGILNPYGGPYPANFWTPVGEYKTTKGTMVTDVRWTQCYALSSPGVPAFGDTTIVMAKTVASKASNVRSDRKLSMITTRMIPTWNGSVFTGPLVADEFGENVFMAILKDQALGNVPNAQIDFPGIAAAFQAVRDYFHDDLTRFSHTFDSENTTLEDMLAQVADSCFCTAYREGNVIKVKPNVASNNAVVLFNHRNITKGSQQMTSTFGTQEDYDGVKVDYFDDSSNTLRTLTVPNSSVSKPREITVAGLRTRDRAMTHAWRALNRIRYQKCTVEFEACEEAALVVVQDKILVADRTNIASQEGEIVAVSGLTLTTSQDVSITGSTHTIFLQHTDGSVESIAVASRPGPRTLVLSTAPALALVTNDDGGVRTGYILVGAAETRNRGFILQEKSAQSRLTWSMKAYNYSHGYFFMDGLQLWIAPSVGLTTDKSPYERATTVNGGSVTSDVTRGLVFQGTGPSSWIDIVPTAGTSTITGYGSYTKSVWVNKSATGTAVDLLSMTGVGPNEERFLISISDVVRVFHAGIAYVTMAAYPLAAWHMLTVVFDEDAGTMALYLDAELVDSATGVPTPGVRSGLRAFEGLVGFVDELRLYRRALSAEEVLELYHRTRL